jgi:hypothetical protein
MSRYLPSASCVRFICICFHSKFPIWPISTRECALFEPSYYLPVMYKRCPPTSQMDCQITKAFVPFAHFLLSFSSHKNCLSLNSWSLQDLRCSDPIWTSSIKAWEQHFPRFTPSVLPRGQRTTPFSFLCTPFCPFSCSKIPSPNCLVLFQ